MKSRRILRSVVLCVVATVVVACEQSKSSSPLSPNVAGPMEGVNITMPLPVDPASGQKVKDADQPLNLIIEEAHTNGPRPVTMAFEIATDVGFTNIAFSRSGIAPSGDGLTKVRLPDRLQAGRSYYWRIKADDGANSTGWSNAAFFEIMQPIFIGGPEPLTPVANVRVSSSTPELRVRNSQTTGPVGSLGYHFQISDNQTFNTLFAEAWVTQGNGETAYVTPGLPAPDKTFFWRTRASDGPNNGNWGRTESFRSPVAAPPPPPPPGGGGSGGGGGGGGQCNASSPLAIVICERSKWGHMSSGEIVQFLRDVTDSLNRNKISDGPYGLLRKSGGHQCNGYSCDIICAGQGGGQKQWDVLSDAEGAQNPVWGGPIMSPNIRVDVCEIR